ncbi:MAG: MFS transporter [Phenylobacterium sp.]|uniref:MFS transporter n=1 Tax=Phenylobacterium sp. TaxID=1871053 RepID=UPI0027332EE7|nr:MFS transporter [Phenylobacterium sp.]MDP3745635.1 MFS transporter [Phenylobacterium sp.]
MAVGRSGTKAELNALYTVILIDSISYALIVPFLPFLLMDIGAGAALGGAVVTVHALTSVLSAPIMGRLSDRFGRKPLLIITLVGTLISYLLFAVSSNLAMLIFARALAGAMAGNLGVVHAALADATSEEERGKAMSFATAVWALGFVVGPGLGALLTLTSLNHQAIAPGVLAAVATSVSILLVSRFVIEPTSRGSEPAPTDSLPAAGVQGQHVLLLTLLVLLALCQSGLVAMTGFWSHETMGWSARGVSLFMLWVAATIVPFQAVVMPRLFDRFTSPAILSAGLTACAAASLTLYFVSGNLVAVCIGAAVLFCGITGNQAVVDTMLSRSATSGGQGRVMGLAMGAGALGRVIGPTSFGWIFASQGAQSPYLTASVIALLGLGLLLASPTLRRPGAGGPPDTVEASLSAD